MNMMPSAVETKIEQLMVVLDEDIRHLETTLSQLDALRGLLVKREDAALEGLLGEIRGRTEAYAANERTRQTLRTDLALMLGCDPSRFTLSRLQSMLPEPRQTAVTSRRARLRFLVTELKREYTLTAVLVSDCARFNRALMRAFFGTGSQVGTLYKPSGQAKQQTNAALMSLKL
jgi:thiamine pyrophosphate-dependent acetolactate synthase large subunit-like protein